MFGFRIRVRTGIRAVATLGFSSASLNSWFDHVHRPSDLNMSRKVTIAPHGSIHLVELVV
jgi:hypothetical protein